MNFDTKNNVANAIYSSNEMTKSATTTQIKRYSDANTSFATEMRTSAEKKNIENSTEETNPSENLTQKEQQLSTTKKEDKKLAEKSVKEDSVNNNGTEEYSTENQTFNSQSEQWQNQNSNQQNGQNEYTPLTAQINAYMNANGVDFNFASINPMSATSQSQLSGLPATVNYSSIQMSDSDAKFFADLVTKTDMTAASVAAEFEKQMQNGNIKTVQSTAKASAALIEALKESAKNHQAFRVDFDKDISVILQVDRGGKINANFIPGDKAVEAYLRNNIDILRQKFNEENIAYGDLTYSQSRKNKQDRERNNKENSHE